MIAVIMSTVSLLTIELNKALAKKDYSSSKDSSGGGGGSDSWLLNDVNTFVLLKI